MRVTSTPREASPSAKARDSSGEEGRMSWPMTARGVAPVAASGRTTTSANAAPMARTTPASSWSGTVPRTS